MTGNELAAARTRRMINTIHGEKSMYGTPEANFWFVGLEGGNHPTKTELDNFFAREENLRPIKKYRSLRGQICKINKQTNLCDDHPVHKKTYHPCLYSGNDYDAKWQPTYGGYIKMLLSLTQEQWNLNDVKKYQKFALGEIDENITHRSSLLELYPLDCQRRKAWPYKHMGKIPGLEFLSSGRKYREWALEPEWNKILKLIDVHQPNYVFVYGKDSIQLAMNNKKLNFSYRDISTKGVAKTIRTGFANLGETQLVFARHPTGHTSDIYWKNIATELKSPKEKRMAA